MAPLTDVAEETAKYDTVWRLPEYRRRCHGLQLWTERRDLFPASIASAIDLGCGLGHLFARWNEDGIDGWGVDLTARSLDEGVARHWGHKFMVASLWAFRSARQFDVGACVDVLEHLPEPHLADALARMATSCRTVVFKIANFPSERLGFVLHLTQQDARWWHARLVAAMGGSVTRCAYETDREEYVFRWARG